MPYRWTDDTHEKTLTLWPHQSLTPRGFTWFIGATSFMLTLPLLAVLGSPVAWVLMVFFLGAIAAVWRAIMANRADRSLHEELTLSTERVHLQHVPSRGPVLQWEANPHWVSVNMRNDGPVENYLTLRGGGREVELGSFLTPEEREGLYRELNGFLRPI
ncbi:DUF2244 domain-containing protein [Silicimonas sp. MF1-12-2]|jgi:uncharacterized membrane protein|uniref:DUF2244 domain-containing protein n=1 Tax=Silicimonas sp. MF1-12-2 TaxID=3384793 RepID=UPI0039B62D02